MKLGDVLGDVAAFYEQQAARCRALGIEVSGLPISHVAFRARTWREYLSLRERLEQLAVANRENVWNGRPISKIVLAEPIAVGERQLDLVELIPPFHQRVYRMGLEHYGFVVGEGERFSAFVAKHRPVLTGQQFQSPENEPVYILFPDYTHVKFHQRSLADAVRREGLTFDGFVHADWQPLDELAGPYEVA